MNQWVFACSLTPIALACLTEVLMRQYLRMHLAGLRAVLTSRRNHAQRRVLRTSAGLAVALLLAACSRSTDPSSALLRVHNAGTIELLDLRVIFPDTAVSFGAVATGATTDYRLVPGGVYRYAAFSFTHQGAGVGQPVDDWVGEVPLEGRRFTYTLQLMTTAQGQPGIAILSVAKDP